MPLIWLVVCVLLALPAVDPLWTRPNVETAKCVYCDPITVYLFPNGDWNADPVEVSLTQRECTSKQELSSILCAHMDVAQCSLFTPWGTRITSCADISHGNNIFIVPDRKLFVLPSKGPGTSTVITHTGRPNGNPITVEALADSPRVFKLHSFFTPEESAALLHDAQRRMSFVDSYLKQAKQEPAKLASVVLSKELLAAAEQTGQTGRVVDLSTDPPFFSAGEDLDNANEAASKQYPESEIAKQLKRRVFEALGIFPLDDSYNEGWQMWKYTAGQGYNMHYDWIEPSFLSMHDFNSAYEGTNRFAAVMLFLPTNYSTTEQQERDEHEDGGEIVFPMVDATPSQRQQQQEKRIKRVIHDLHWFTTQDQSDSEVGSQTTSDERTSVFAEPSLGATTGKKNKKSSKKAKKNNENVYGHEAAQAKYEAAINDKVVKVFPPDSWEYDMSEVQCQHRLTVTGTPLSAVVVYTQKPNGLSDSQAAYGICPLQPFSSYNPRSAREMHVATLWVWNGPKAGHWQRNAVTGQMERPPLTSVSASFEVVDLVPAKLFWEDKIWEELIVGRPVKVNTYPGHNWKVMLGDEVVAQWVIAADKAQQRFVLSAADIPPRFFKKQQW